VVLIPGGRHLDLLPLHAAWTEDQGAAAGRRYALDEVLLTYAPSARVLQAVSRRADQSASDILAVFDPKLRNSELEAKAARGWLGSGAVLRKDTVTRRSLQAMLPRYSVLHSSCHGFADLDSPLDSRLAAASDEPLTLRDILENTLSARLCVLSACESARAGGFVPDQALSLPGGLLHAGAAGVVGSLWPVGDLQARVLLTRFYELWQGDGLEPAEALRQAQLWMRDSAAGPDAAHWGAFVYVGA
jgi:CHAT domain-containing protein